MFRAGPDVSIYEGLVAAGSQERYYAVEVGCRGSAVYFNCGDEGGVIGGYCTARAAKSVFGDTWRAGKERIDLRWNGRYPITRRSCFGRGRKV